MVVDPEKIGGVYLVVDPSGDREELLGNVRRSLENGTDLLQVWNHWPESAGEGEKRQLIEDILELARDHGAPVLINEEWQWLKSTGLDGVHFDDIPDDFPEIRREIGRAFLAGVTCENSLETVRWADEIGMDYISFCALFPSPSVSGCEIVRPETVRRARELTDLPLFLSGGITPERLPELRELDFNGVAVISGILEADDPGGRTAEYKRSLEHLQEEPS